jgi:hypothetical protein
MQRAPLLFAAAAITAACGSSSTNDPANPVATTVACDPLATHPTTLATVLGVGQDAAGTTYVVDATGTGTVPSSVRVFVGSGGTLVRQDVLGSGSTLGEDIETFQAPDGSTTPMDLTIELASGTATSMTIGPEGSGKMGLEGIDAGAPTVLKLGSASTVAGMPATDLPGEVDYVADGADGNAIVVTSPLDNDEGTAAFHLFYGPPGAMVERPITSFEQALCCYPTIAFTVASKTYTMAIASMPSDGGLGEDPGPVTLTTPTGTVAFTLRVPNPKTLAGFTFSCLGS